MNHSRPQSTPVQAGQVLQLPTKKMKVAAEESKEETEIEYIDYPVQEAVGSILYAGMITRWDACNAIRNVCKVFLNPGRLIAYVDASFAEEKDRRSTTGWVVTMNGEPVAWKSATQSLTTSSTTASEYVALASVVTELMYLETIKIWFYPKVGVPVVYKDNLGAMLMANSEEDTKRSKYIDNSFHEVRQAVAEKFIDFRHVATEHMMVDILIKNLGRIKFEYFTIGMNNVTVENVNQLASRHFSN